jgi:protein arginine kinase activator
MKCDHCDSEATIHEVVIRNGKQAERHLCEKCAVEQGVEIRPNLKVGDLIQKLAGASPAGGAEKAGASPRDGVKCELCGTSFAEFRQSGLLGCAECYRAFELKLGPLLERAHEGASHLVGKVPRRALEVSRTAPPDAEPITGGERERRQRTVLLRKQLDDAIAGEQYERAAKIRDELSRISQVGPGASARGAGDAA